MRVYEELALNREEEDVHHLNDHVTIILVSFHVQSYRGYLLFLLFRSSVYMTIDSLEDRQYRESLTFNSDKVKATIIMPTCTKRLRS